MKSAKPIIFVATASMVFLGVVVFLSQSGYFLKAQTSFPPPYPETNARGDPILAVFEGRVPCPSPDCEKMKVGLVLYYAPDTKAPTTYWLGIVSVGRGNDRIVTQGTWTARRGARDYPDAEVYELDANASPDLRRYWRVNDDVMLPLDQSMSPKAGNSAWGYMLSRYAGPYGPRVYQR